LEGEKRKEIKLSGKMLGGTAAELEVRTLALQNLYEIIKIGCVLRFQVDEIIWQKNMNKFETSLSCH